ncbi:MAG: hypothetical protein F2667_04965 [Actinobacteria bacterium]|uniref:Unannotated protein n=1 Tax=freshwater metagenome TaxID=449393 RepID=A0A6J6PQK4_9ZZZZ|nr:hypothetical protein [Actinomycetota bacterium]
MSQAAATQSAPAPSTTSTSTTSTAIKPAAPARATEDVPRLLNRWQVIAVTVCVLFGVASAGLQLLSWQANRAAADNTEQLVRVQGIQSTLFRADALATNAFLNGGLEPADRRQAYDDAIDHASRGIADAAEAQPADRAALAELNTLLTQYASTIELARANNRQGFPVGAEYLRTASTALRADALPIVQALVDANAARAEDEMDGQRPLVMLVPGVLALLVLRQISGAIARRFRRRVNVGLAAAFASIAALSLVGLVVTFGQQSDNDTLLDGSYAQAVDEASARTAANDAKSNESLRLISRGSGSAFEAAWAAAAQVVEDTASPDTLPAWQEYADRHAALVALDDAGDWDRAVRNATTSGDQGSTAALEAFDAQAQAVVDDSAEQTTEELRAGNTGILVLALISLAVGIAAAGLATWGIAQRRREYA